MFDIILFSPKIPPNTGNIIRLSANTGSRLHLIKPLGFTLDEKSCRRAGLDYHALSNVKVHDNLPACINWLNQPRLFALTTKSQNLVFGVNFKQGDALLFGSETSGLPAKVHDSIQEEQKLRLPMVEGSRSLNLANAVSIVIYEAWRQLDFSSSLTPSK